MPFTRFSSTVTMITPFLLQPPQTRTAPCQRHTFQGEETLGYLLQMHKSSSKIISESISPLTWIAIISPQIYLPIISPSNADRHDLPLPKYRSLYFLRTLRIPPLLWMFLTYVKNSARSRQSNLLKKRFRTLVTVRCREEISASNVRFDIY